MSLMKRFLEQRIFEFSQKIHVSEELIYRSNILYDLATRYAQLKLLLLQRR